MKNITAQYKLLKEGKISQANFMRIARMTFPNLIANVSSFDDSIRILKNKGILGESVDQWESDFISDLKDRMVDPSQAEEILAKAKQDLQNHGETLKSMYGIFASPSGAVAFLSDYAPEQNKKISETSYEEKPSKEDIIANFFQDYQGTLDPTADEMDYKYAQELEKRLADAGYEAGFDLSGGFADDTDEEMYEGKRSLNEASTNSGYVYIKEKFSIPEIDLVNPYQLQMGIEEELSKMKDISGNAYFEAMDKAIKAIAKDVDKYRDLQIANFKEVKKIDQENKMVEVGKKVKSKAKTDHSGYIKKPLKKDEGANVTDKKENKKGKPKGVKEMTNKPKKVAGISKTMELPGKEKVLKALKEHLTKKKEELTEDMHHEYTRGMEVHTPSGMGIVHEIVGSTITVELADGGMKDYQVNVLNKQKEAAKNAPQMEAHKEKPKKGVTKEQVMNKLKEFFSKKKKKTEAYVAKDAITGTTIDAGRNTAAGMVAAKNLKAKTGRNVVVTDLQTGKETKA